MARNILAVVIGYISIFFFVFVTFTLLYLALGPTQTFVPGTFDVTMTWVVPSVALSIFCGIAGGFICAKIGADSRAVTWLAVTVFVLGILMALPMIFSAPPSGIRDNNLANMEAMMQARQPLWVAVVNPIIGALSVLIGGTSAKK
ncbi:MAG: hypothetical protein IPN69_06435 [Acidobacteria bacterium]|nr:hypothetical protein [Acidobacteriota bacterium]MBK8147194.1 hypothetical protein [Acidobacteriota bacterium]MBK8810359.1 hypothetical protein [Acidobacteriota bacterium]